MRGERGSPFPRLNVTNPLRDNQLPEFAPCGVIAGLNARTDARWGVRKAPAGPEATMLGVRAVSIPLTDGENGRLNPPGAKCGSFPVVGDMGSGAWTLEGADEMPTPADIDRDSVNILVGFAPLQPVEFVLVRIQQLAGQLQAWKHERWSPFSVNVTRLDPYMNSRVRVKRDGTYVKGIRKMAP